MTDLKQIVLGKVNRWLCISALLLCACSQLPEHCGDYVSIGLSEKCAADDVKNATTYTLTTNASPTAGGTVSPAGQTTHDAGTSVTVTATAASGYTFTGWAGASTSTSGTITVTMNSNRTLTANFRQTVNPPNTYTLTTNASPATGGSVSPAGQTTHDAGASVTVTAMAVSGYTFTGWEGASMSTNQSVTITMNSNQTLTANFRQIVTPPNTYTLSTGVLPAEGGTVSPAGQTNHDIGATVTVTATPATGYEFSAWSGASSSTNATVTITMNSNHTLTAVFRQERYALTTGASPAMGGTVSPAGLTTHDAGATVTVTAAAESGYMFTGWSGSASSTDNSITITMSGNQTLTANFVWSGGTIDDPRDGQSYRTIKIGNQTWMAENLNYETSTYSSWCYDNSPDSCDKYGKLYIWDAAMVACPTGWHLPTREEWNELVQFVGDAVVGDRVSGIKLKSKIGWNSGGNGTNDYGFSALPGGHRNSRNSNVNFYYNAGRNGDWWSATEGNNMYRDLAYNLNMRWDNDNVNETHDYKSSGYSVRCVRDD